MAEHQNPVAQLQQHVQILADEHHGHALFLLLVEQVIDHIAGVDVQTAHRVGGDQQVRVGFDLAAQQHLLHVAAAHQPHRGLDAGGHDGELLHQLFRQCTGRGTIHKGALAIPVALQQHVVGHAHAGHQTHAQTVLGHKAHGDAQVDDGLGALAQNVLFLIKNRALLGGDQARDGLAQLLLTAAGNTGHAQDLAGVDVEAHIVQTLAAVGLVHGQVHHLQDGVHVFRLRAADGQAHRVAHHQLGEPGGVHTGGGHAAHAFALAQDGHPVADGQHLVQLVGDDDDGAALGLHLAQNGKQLVGLLRGEHGGGLVQNQDLRAPVQHLQNLHGLLFRNAHLVHRLLRVDFQTVIGAQLLDLGLQGLFARQLAGGAQHDVLHGGEHLHQLEVLVDHADAQILRVHRGADAHRLPGHEDLAVVRMIDAGDHIHQGSFAAAVFAQQRQDLAVLYVQLDAVVGHHAAEPLGDAAAANGAFLFAHEVPPPCVGCVCAGPRPHIPEKRGCCKIA